MNEEGAGPGPGDVPPPSGGVEGQLLDRELADDATPELPRSHRGGMPAGLVAVGLLLGVLVLVAPGGSTPPLRAQSVHDRGSAAARVRTDATTTSAPSGASSTTTTGAPGVTTITAAAGRHSVNAAPAGVTLVAAPTPSTTTTAPAAPLPTTTSTTTTTTAPPSTTLSTTTTTTTTCILILCG